MVDFLWFLLGMGLLLMGGRALVGAAVGIANRMHVPTLLVGLTIVAWGTSAPEVAFNLMAAIRGKPDLVFGNLVGASICNLGLVLGCAALIAPLAVHATVVRREVPLMLLMFLLMLAAALVPGVQQALGGRLDSTLLLAAFLAYAAYTIREGMRQSAENRELARQTRRAEAAEMRRPLWLSVGLMGVGLALLSVGGALASDAASAIARMLGMSDRVLGLTVVSFGTTTPELVTAIIAVRRGHTDLAVGNAVGSCLFNLGMIFAACGLIAPAPTPEGGAASLITMLVLGAALVPMVRVFNGGIARAGGVVLIAIHAAFVGYELWRLRYS